MQHNRTNSEDQQERPAPLDERDLADLDRLLGKLRGRHSAPAETEPGRETERALLVQRARAELEQRRRRADLFGSSMFAEPAWEILLTLYGERSGQRQAQSNLVQIAGSNRSLGTRWIDHLELQGLVSRDVQPADRRMQFVALTDKGTRLLDLYLSGTA